MTVEQFQVALDATETQQKAMLDSGRRPGVAAKEGSGTSWGSEKLRKASAKGISGDSLSEPKAVEGKQKPASDNKAIESKRKLVPSPVQEDNKKSRTITVYQVEEPPRVEASPQKHTKMPMSSKRL